MRCLALVACAAAACKSGPDMMPGMDAMDPGLIDVPDMRVLGDAPLNSNSNWDVVNGLLPDFECTGWTLVDTATPEDPVIVDGKLDMLTSAGAEDMHYRQEGPELQPQSSVTITATTWLKSNNSSQAAASALDIGFRLSGKANILRIEDTAIFLMQNATTKGPTFATMTNDAFHDYRVELQVSSGAITVFYDNTQVLTGTAYSTTEIDAIWFGDNSAAAYGESYWLRFGHNAHMPTHCP